MDGEYDGESRGESARGKFPLHLAPLVKENSVFLSLFLAIPIR
jgi:hypothetical protein